MHRLFKYYRFVVIVMISIVITACVNNSQDSNNLLAWQKHQKELTNLTHFQATGSLSFVTDKTKYYGRFFINQTAENEYQLKLTSPVGTSIFSLMVTPYLAELTDNNGKKYIDENVERLMARLTGMDIPFKSLHHWFKGGSDNPNKDKFNSQGLLTQTTIEQDDQQWLLSITKYKTYKYNHKNIELPANIQLTNKQDQMKITINNWTIN